MTAMIGDVGIVLFLCGGVTLNVIMAERAFRGDVIIAGVIFVALALVTLAAVVKTIRDI